MQDCGCHRHGLFWLEDEQETTAQLEGRWQAIVQQEGWPEVTVQKEG